MFRKNSSQVTPQKGVSGCLPDEYLDRSSLQISSADMTVDVDAGSGAMSCEPYTPSETDVDLGSDSMDEAGFLPEPFDHMPCTLPTDLDCDWDAACAMSPSCAEEAAHACQRGRDADHTADNCSRGGVQGGAPKCFHVRSTREKAPRAIDEPAVSEPAAAAPQQTGNRASKPSLLQAPLRRRWCPDEEQRFLKALEHFRNEVVINVVDGRVSVQLGPTVAEVISIMVKTRSAAQVRSHVQKHFIRLEREASRAS